MTNLATALVDAGDQHADRPALRLDEHAVTYGEFLETARAVAGLLRAKGLEPGDRVGLVFPNVPAFPLAFYGALTAGCAVVPMNPLLKAREIEYYLKDSAASLVIAWDGAADAAREAGSATDTEVLVLAGTGPTSDQLEGVDPVDRPVERDDADTAVVLYTSGTTGSPKGAELTQANLLTNAR
ncbi:MAG: long-chain acyl-CoA synthetase, partial [Actinomycetota bacterium]|nr:long-chain acyl-CoA synthetase [Actinomycetota bacterium]